MVPFQALVYVPDRDDFVEEDKVPAGSHTLDLSGTELRRHLAEGRTIPEWFTFPEVARELQVIHRPRREQGFTIFFTGLSGAGKSTIANALLVKFLESGGRPVTLLDGDLVRKNLSSELGFSREHRDLNIRRIGYVASEITKHGGVAVCAPIAPYQQTRQQVREMIQPHGGFILVHVATPIEECERRDRKGLYAKARAGIVKEFTGVSDPYQPPADADIVLDTIGETPEQSAQKIPHLPERTGVYRMITLDVAETNRMSKMPIRKRSWLWSWNTFGPQVAASSSFQTNSVPLLHMISRAAPQMVIFFLDTGFHFPETLLFRDQLMRDFHLNVRSLTAEMGHESFRRKYGELFQHDPDLCCHMNKVEPLERARRELRAWISGIRRDQTASRAGTPGFRNSMTGHTRSVRWPCGLANVFGIMHAATTCPNIHSPNWDMPVLVVHRARGRSAPTKMSEKDVGPGFRRRNAACTLVATCRLPDL